LKPFFIGHKGSYRGLVIHDRKTVVLTRGYETCVYHLPSYQENL